MSQQSLLCNTISISWNSASDEVLRTQINEESIKKHVGNQYTNTHTRHTVINYACLSHRGDVGFVKPFKHVQKLLRNNLHFQPNRVKTGYSSSVLLSSYLSCHDYNHFVSLSPVTLQVLISSTCNRSFLLNMYRKIYSDSEVAYLGCYFIPTTE